MNAPIAPPQKGVLLVSGPEEGTSYWQPLPSTGYATVKLHPGNSPINFLSAGIQVLEPGTHVRNHAHQRTAGLAGQTWSSVCCSQAWSRWARNLSEP